MFESFRSWIFSNINNYIFCIGFYEFYDAGNYYAGGIDMIIRFAAAHDSTALLNIYAQYINTAITFECTLPTEREFSNRIYDIQKEYPYLVCEESGHIVGYAYAHRHKEREAYQWNAELSIYLDKAFTSKGLGKKLYQLLIDLLKLQGVKTVYGGVTIPNEKSEKLHRTMGFHHLGTYHNTGYKCGRWLDVAWFEKEIAPYTPEPAPFKPITHIPLERLDAIMNTD